MPAFQPIQTPRLILRPFKESDLEPFHAYRSDPEIEKYQGWGEYTLEHAQKFIDAEIKSSPGDDGESAQIAIELKESGEMIGDLHLHIPEDEPDQAVLGYSIATEHQGHGYASEALTALLDYVFGTLNKRRVTAGADAENATSIALMERVGMRKEAHFIQSEWFREKYADEVRYAILKSEWRNRSLPSP